MDTQTSKCLILRATFLKEGQKILSVYSEEYGLFSVIVKGCNSPLKSSLSEPFCEAEISFKKGSSDLRRFHDGSIIDLHLKLREKLGFIQSATAIVKALLDTQLTETPSKPLYHLVSGFLKSLPLFTSQDTILGCFYLKLLRHEGLYNKETFSHFKSALDIEKIDKIALTQSFIALKQLTLSKPEFEAIKAVFSSNTKLS